MSEIKQRVAAFRRSITPNLLARDDFIDWNAIEVEIRRVDLAVQHLQAFSDIGEFGSEELSQELKSHPDVYEIILNLVAYNSSGTQVTKWGLPPTVPPDETNIRLLADQLLYIGIDRLLRSSPPIEALLRVAEVYKDSFRRRFRSGKKLEFRIQGLVRKAIASANSRLETPVRNDASALTDGQLRRSLEYVIAAGKRPIAGIATVFQNQSGGRQQRDLAVTYPLLQERLAAHGMQLILITDGQGLREASERTLALLFESVRFPMTIEQAIGGMLEESIIEASTAPAPTTLDNVVLNRLISGALDAREKILADTLPVPSAQGVLALARYAETHQELNLSLSPAGDELRWKNPGALLTARSLTEQFDPRRALDGFTSLLGSTRPDISEQDGEVWAAISIAEIPPFTGRLHVTASTRELSSDVPRDIGLRSIEDAPGSSVAILLTQLELSGHELEARRKSQAVLPVNVVLVSPTMLVDMAKSASPLAKLVDALLNQSDLTKVSPFILSNPTPSRMFYGRDTEAATVLGTIATNSVAILGSRRIGKTSLMRRVQSDLEDSNFRPFFGDCQTVRTWQDFATLAHSDWDVVLPPEFEPRHLSDLVKQLGARQDRNVVLLLDEIDQLLDWDRGHSENSVPEAFFRACRSISQAGSAQFVFSGERTIANRIWDPQSPHWNFCRPLDLTQLTKDAATSLLVQPLQAMNIRIIDEVEFGTKAWERTNGHPQIAQFLGDRLVRLLDERADRRELSLGAEEIGQVTDTYEFAEHYLNTYWGQANPLEKSISLLVGDKTMSAADIGSALLWQGSRPTDDELMSALRMLQLFGILKAGADGFSLRAEWFPSALAHFGGVTVEANELVLETVSC